MRTYESPVKNTAKVVLTHVGKCGHSSVTTVDLDRGLAQLVWCEHCNRRFFANSFVDAPADMERAAIDAGRITAAA
jgi:hypothetical protein